MREVPVDTQEIEIVSVNVWGLPWPIAPERRERLPAMDPWLADLDADVVAVQELWRRSHRWFRVPAYLPDRAGDSGLALLSRHPVRRSEITEYALERSWDALKSKGMFAVELDVHGQPMLVVDTHLQSYSGDRNATIRAAQIDAILASVSQVAMPCVLVGDVNFYRDHPIDQATERRLADAGFVDALAVVGATEPTYPGTVDRYDRIFVRDGDSATFEIVSGRVLSWTPDRLSDHLAISAIVRLVPR